MQINQKKLFSYFFMISGVLNAQFMDSFDDIKLNGWYYFTGDGEVKMNVKPNSGYARIYLDATEDKHNVWWAVLKRDISEFLDLEKLKDPLFELRVEAKIRVSSAPKRVNFMVNTQRTKDFHIDLMEFDIPDTNFWHTISMTTNNFDAIKGDTVYIQFDITDWGSGEFFVDLDYYRADIINRNLVGLDNGVPVPYHPPILPIDAYSNHLLVPQDCIINSDFPDVNFYNWHTKNENGELRILTVGSNQFVILRWDFENFKNHEITTSGILELTTQFVQLGGNYCEIYGKDLGIEFGKIRVSEIHDGDPNWDKKKVTFNNFINGNEFESVINSQMIYDTKVSYENGSKNYITISKPVLERLKRGLTKGLLISPLGAINASFYSSDNKIKEYVPKLHFNMHKK